MTSQCSYSTLRVFIKKVTGLVASWHEQLYIKLLGWKPFSIKMPLLNFILDKAEVVGAQIVKNEKRGA